jgi:hypothetical protein
VKIYCCRACCWHCRTEQPLQVQMLQLPVHLLLALKEMVPIYPNVHLFSPLLLLLLL